MTFDAWEVGIRPSEDYLVHWGIRGMKHGRRRYQNEDGTWTEAGLAARRKREGFGEGRDERKAAKQAARTEKKAARQAARAEAKAAYAEKKRLSTVKGLTDAELKARIERVKMEQEYKELTKSPLLKAGEKFVEDYFQTKNERQERALAERREKRQDERDKANREHEMAKLKEQTEQQKLRTESEKARAEADKKRAETDKIDIEKGTRMARLKNERRSLKLQSKRHTSDNTIIGGARKMINKLLSGNGDRLSEEMHGIGESRAAYRRGVTDARIAKKQNKILTRRNRKLDPWEPQAQIRESGQDYWRQKEPKNKNKKKGQGGD